MGFRSLKAGLLAAVAVAGMASMAYGQNVTLNLVGSDPPATFEPVIAAYKQQHPDVTIEYQQIPFNSFNAQIEARVGSQDPSIDIYMADTPRVPALASKGYLLDLSDLSDDIKAIATPTEVTAVSYKDKIFAFPLWTGTQLLYYNKDVLKAAGLSDPSGAPADRMTWDQTLDMAKAIQKSGVKYGFGFAQPDRYFQLQPLFESIGAGSGLTGDTLLTPDLTNEGWIRVGNWYRDLFDSGISPRGVSPEQMPDLFLNGQLGLIYGGLPLIKRFNAAEGLHYGVAPVPYFADGKPVTSTGSWSIGINPYSNQKDAAIDFARFLTLSPEGATLAMQNTSAVPVNKDAYVKYLENLAASTKNVGPAGDILTYEIQNTAVPRPRSIGYVVFEEVMNKAFSDIRNGADVQPTFEQAQNQLKSSLSRIR